MLQFHGSEDYIASEELISSVNIAVALKKPLLIKGEPGTGKTMLAEVLESQLPFAGVLLKKTEDLRQVKGQYVY